MKDELQSHLRQLADAFCAREKLASTTVWARAANDARFMDRIEGGAGFNVTTYDRAVRWFADNWPEGAQWPDCIKRPTDARRETLSAAE